MPWRAIKNLIELPEGSGKSDVLTLLTLKKRAEHPGDSEAPESPDRRKMIEWRADLLTRIEEAGKALVEGLRQENTKPARAPGGSRGRRIEVLSRRIQALTLENDELRWQNADLKQFVTEVGPFL